jgi:integrase
MRWDEFDETGKSWTLPWYRTKQGKKTKEPHVVPLSEPAMQVVLAMRAAQKTSSIPSDHVFAHGRAFEGVGAWEGKPLEEHSARRLMQKRFRDRPITLHGFRSSFSTWANDQGPYAHKTIELSLGHVVGNKTSRAYDHAQQLRLRRLLMEAWGAFITRPEPLPATVTPLRKAN